MQYPQRRPHRGFTLVELMIVVAIISILSAVAIPAYIQYTRRAKNSEPLINLKNIFNGVVLYYATEHYDSAGVLLPRLFPVNAGPTPPLGTCCGQPGNKCSPNPAYWVNPTWEAVAFNLDDAFYYQYEAFRTVGTGANSNDQFRMSGYGDLNCNNVYGWFIRYATLDANKNTIGTSVAIVLPTE